MTSPEFSWPRWLSLKQTAAYSNIGQKRLIELAKKGQIKGFQDPDSGRRDWIFDRLSIDAYRETQPPSMTSREKALDILKTIPL